MLSQEYLDLLIRTILGAIRTQLTFQILVNSVKAGAWNSVPAGAGYNDAAALIVAEANGQGWLRDLVKRLATDYPTRPEFAQVLAEIDRADTVKPGLGTKLQSTGSSVLRAVGSVGALLSAQLKFFAGLLVGLASVASFLILVPDDEIAIKPLDEGGGRAKFVTLQYWPKVASAAGRRDEQTVLDTPDADGFYRIQHRVIAEPPQIDLTLDEARLPPRWAGNDKKTVLQVVKVNYQEFGFPFWNKSRKLFLYVKLQSFNTPTAGGGSP